MYIPYFRGKQFDLIGLRESVSMGLVGKSTFPLIEPVRDSKQLLKTLGKFVEKQQEILVVVNPEVGQVQKGMTKLHGWEEFYDCPYVTPVYIINHAFEAEDMLRGEYVFLSTNYIRDKLEKLAKTHQPKYHIISDVARLRRQIKTNRVLLTDPFTKLNHGADYLELEDEFYCDDYKFIKEDGYIGFSNYGIDGEHYYDKGFPSRTVVLHILYLDRYNSIRIKHFASDSNESHENPKVKFNEALGKLVKWQNYFSKEIPLTVGLSELVSYYYSGEYLGPGTVKKLLVMHQLELMGKISSP